jgi:hypothetical protein
MLAGTGLGGPPHLFATFSLWRTAREMIEYSSYASAGAWDGRDPLAESRRPGSALPA